MNRFLIHRTWVAIAIFGVLAASCRPEDAEIAASESAEKCTPADSVIRFEDKAGNVYANLPLSVMRSTIPGHYNTYDGNTYITDSRGEITIRKMECGDLYFYSGDLVDESRNYNYPSTFVTKRGMNLGEKLTKISKKNKYKVTFQKVLYSNTFVANSFGDSGGAFWGSEAPGTAQGTAQLSFFQPGSTRVAQPVRLPATKSFCSLGLGLYANGVDPVDSVQIHEDNSGQPGTLLYEDEPTYSDDEGVGTSYGNNASLIEFCAKGLQPFTLQENQTYWIVARYNQQPGGVHVSYRTGLHSSGGLTPLESSNGSSWSRAFGGWTAYDTAVDPNRSFLIPSFTRSTAIRDSYFLGTLAPEDFTIEVFLVE